MRQPLGHLFVATLLVWVTVAAQTDFDRVKAELAAASCVTLEFLSIVESDVFNTVDTAAGTAYLARDGRYRVDIGGDTYLFEGEHLYSYSRENNQVTIEQADYGDALSEVSFITRLDDVYNTVEELDNGSYVLERIDSLQSGLPDRLALSLDGFRSRLGQIDFADINGDPNSLVISRQQLDSTCDDGRFIPDFPDSVERVRLF